jgi:hypothetical protein
LFACRKRRGGLFFFRPTDGVLWPYPVVANGGATDWSIADGGSSFGPTVAAEVTPIENWLELEFGVTPLFTRHSTEWDADLLFKMPWTLSKKAEFMLGVGRE